MQDAQNVYRTWIHKQSCSICVNRERHSNRKILVRKFLISCLQLSFKEAKPNLEGNFLPPGFRRFHFGPSTIEEESNGISVLWVTSSGNFHLSLCFSIFLYEPALTKIASNKCHTFLYLAKKKSKLYKSPPEIGTQKRDRVFAWQCCKWNWHLFVALSPLVHFTCQRNTAHWLHSERPGKQFPTHLVTWGAGLCLRRGRITSTKFNILMWRV